MILHIFALSVKWMMFKNSCKNIEKCRDMYRIQKTIFFSFFLSAAKCSNCCLLFLCDSGNKCDLKRKVMLI